MSHHRQYFYLINGIDLPNVPFYVLFFFILSGLLSSISGIFYYKALELSDSTDYGIFAQLSPIIYLVLGWIFLNQHISITHFIALFIIISAPLVIIFSTKKRSRRIKIKAVIYTLINITISAVSYLLFVRQNTSDISFLTEIGLMLIGLGLGDAFIMLASPKWRNRYKTVIKNSKKKVYRPLFANLIVDVLNKIARNLALILASSVALTTAIIDSSKPIVIFFLGLLFTLLWPKFGREKLNRRTIVAHLVATLLVVIGICLINFT